MGYTQGNGKGNKRKAKFPAGKEERHALYLKLCGGADADKLAGKMGLKTSTMLSYVVEYCKVSRIPTVSRVLRGKAKAVELSRRKHVRVKEPRSPPTSRPGLGIDCAKVYAALVSGESYAELSGSTGVRLASLRRSIWRYCEREDLDTPVQIRNGARSNDELLSHIYCKLCDGADINDFVAGTKKTAATLAHYLYRYCQRERLPTMGAVLRSKKTSQKERFKAKALVSREMVHRARSADKRNAELQKQALNKLKAADTKGVARGLGHPRMLIPVIPERYESQDVANYMREVWQAEYPLGYWYEFGDYEFNGFQGKGPEIVVE